MKKSLFLLSIFAIMLNSSVYADFLDASPVNPVNPSGIGNNSAAIQAQLYSYPVERQVLAKAFAVLAADTTWSDTISTTANPSGNLVTFFIGDSLIGDTLYSYGVKAWYASDSSGVPSVTSSVFTFRTLPDPTRAKPVGSVVTLMPGAAILAASGDAIGHTAGWCIHWNDSTLNGFPFVTDTMFVTGEDQIAQFTISGTTPGRTYKYYVFSYPQPYVEGTGPWTDTTRYFTAPMTSFAYIDDIGSSGITESAVTIMGSGVLGTNGNADMRMQIYDTLGTTLVQQTTWLPFTGTDLLQQLTGLIPNTDYLFRVLLRDGANIDTSAFEGFTTLGVPSPSIVLDSAVAAEGGGIIYLTINSNGVWSGSLASAHLAWSTLQIPETVQTSGGVTGLQQVQFPITGVPYSTPVFWRAWVTNVEGDSVALPQQVSLTTPSALVAVQITIGQTSSWGPTSILISNSQYTCAPGDTARFYYVYEKQPDLYSDTTFIGLFSGSGTFTDTLTNLDPGEDYYLKLVAENSDQIWSSSEPRQEQTLPAQQPSFTISTTGIVENGATIRVFGETGGYQSNLHVEARRNDNNMTDWEALVDVGNGDFDQTFQATNLSEGEGYTVWACVINQLGQNCSSEVFQTPTGIMELVRTQNLFVVAYDVLSRPIAFGPYSDVVAQLPFYGIYMLRDQKGARVGEINKLQ